MEKFDYLGDVLASTDRGMRSDRIDTTEVDHDFSKDMMTIQFYPNPACNTHNLGKPLAHSSKIIRRAPKKNNKHQTSHNEISVKELLALSETKYFEDLNKVQIAVKRNKIVQNIRVMMFLIKAGPLVKLLSKMMLKQTFFKWKGLTLERYSKLKPCRSSKLISFLTLLNKIEKRKLMVAFVSFNERGMHVNIMRQCYIVEERYRNKISLFIPPTPIVETNKDKLLKLGFNLQTSKTARVKEEVKKEFKRSRLMKFPKQDGYKEKAMGKSYVV